MTIPGRPDRMAVFCRIVGDHLKEPARDDWRGVRTVLRRLARDNRRWERDHPAPRPAPAPEPPGAPGDPSTTP